MRRLIALFLVGGCLFTAVLFAMGAARAEKCADAVWQNPVLYLEKPISAEDAQNIAESAVFTAWGETADQTVTDPDLGKSVQTNVVWLYGSSEWILPASAVLPADDGKGCLIGKNTAWKLFGSTSVTGLQICVDHQTRTIRGVVQQPGNGVYLQGKDQKKKVFCRLTLASDKMEEAQNFLLQYGLPAAYGLFTQLADTVRTGSRQVVRFFRVERKCSDEKTTVAPDCKNAQNGN